jgi:hypothetical protein
MPAAVDDRRNSGSFESFDRAEKVVPGLKGVGVNASLFE